MKITLEEVGRIAGLAHLQFAGDELERLRGQLDQILEYIGKLEELSTEGVEPAVGPQALDRQRPVDLRDDSLSGTLPLDEALANAPETGQGHFKVPRVIA